jgi:hypothetical protein
LGSSPYGNVAGFVSKDDVEIEGKLHAISMKHELAPASIAYHNKSLSAKG